MAPGMHLPNLCRSSHQTTRHCFCLPSIPVFRAVPRPGMACAFSGSCWYERTSSIAVWRTSSCALLESAYGHARSAAKGIEPSVACRPGRSRWIESSSSAELTYTGVAWA